MHRCLGVPEIRARIVDYVLCCEECDGLASVANLARTSKEFYQPAVEALWRSQRGLRPLVKCFPADIWEEDSIASDEDGEDVSSMVVTFKKPPNSSQWTRVLHYASLIREFSCDDTSCEIDVTVLRDLLIHLPTSEPLLPKLRRLEWGCYNPDIAPYAPMFFVPSLVSLSLMYMSQDMAVDGALLQSLPDRCPRLSEVVIRHAIYPATIDAASEAVLRMPYLRKLVFKPMPLPPKTLVGLSASSLTTLEVRLPDSADMPTAWPADDTPIFNSLETLSITSGGVSEFFVEMLARMSSPKLADVSVSLIPGLRDTVESVGVHSILGAICGRHAGSLRTMHMTVILPSRRVVEDASCSLDHGVLQPLTAATGLISLTVITSNLGLDNKGLGQLLPAWPGLEELTLGPSPGTHCKPRLHIYSLASIITHCPRLRKLSIFVDVRLRSINTQKTPAGGRVNKHLKHLHVYDSQLSTPGVVAAFLSSILPCCKSITAYGKDASAWGEVAGLIPIFADVRVQERTQSDAKRRKRKSSQGMQQKAAAEVAPSQTV